MRTGIDRACRKQVAQWRNYRVDCQDIMTKWQLFWISLPYTKKRIFVRSELASSLSLVCADGGHTRYKTGAVYESYNWHLDMKAVNKALEIV